MGRHQGLGRNPPAVGQAVGVASYPFMAKLVSENRLAELNNLLNTLLRYLAITIPLSVLVIILGSKKISKKIPGALIAVVGAIADEFDPPEAAQARDEETGHEEEAHEEAPSSTTGKRS